MRSQPTGLSGSNDVARFAVTLLSGALLIVGCGGGDNQGIVDAAIVDSSIATDAAVGDALTSDTTLGDGGADANATPDATGDATPDSAGGDSMVQLDGGVTAPTSHGLILWRGLDHDWLRTVVGFAVPHRISQLDTRITDETWMSSPDFSATAKFVMGQSTGVDGNYMKPVGRYAAFYDEHLVVLRGRAHFAWTDDGSNGTYPSATSRKSTTVQLATGLTPLAASLHTEFAAVLQGIEVNTVCDPAKQPLDNPCNSNGMWPYHMLFSVGSCTKGGANVSCIVNVEIDRAWTPNEGGLPPFETKPFNDKLDFDIDVSIAVVMGTPQTLNVLEPTALAASGNGRDSDPIEQTRTVTGAGNSTFARATAGIRSFGFTFFKNQTGDKFNHLGRYIGRLNFGVSMNSYSATTGAISYEQKAQVWVPDTVEQTGVSYNLAPVIFQFGSAPSTFALYENRSVAGSICRNSNGAPVLTAWSQCGSATTGPERTTDTINISAP